MIQSKVGDQAATPGAEGRSTGSVGWYAASPSS